MSNRKLVTHKLTPGSANSLHYWKLTRNPVRIAVQFVLMQLVRIMPSLSLKRLVLRSMGMKVGHNVSIAAMANFDFFFPDLITLEDNCVIGYDALILAHEFLPHCWKTGRTTIGQNSLVGARSIVLAGVEIGPNCMVSAMALVDQPIPPNSFAKGNPMEISRKK